MNEENTKALAAMKQRFGRDCLISIATLNNGAPAVRTVDAYYEDGSFYVITYALSNKMIQIAANSTIAMCGEWFTATATGINMGHIRDEKNQQIADKLRNAFAAWLGNGHVDEEDPNTVILRVKLNNGILFADGECFEIDFTTLFAN